MLVLAILLEYFHKKFQINRTKIKGGCQSVVTHNSKSNSTLAEYFMESPELRQIRIILKRVQLRILMVIFAHVFYRYPS